MTSVDAEAVKRIIGGLVAAGHRFRGRPSEVVAAHRRRLVRHLQEPFVVLPVAAVHLDGGGLVTIWRQFSLNARVLGPT